jgi:hypothetical protein
MWLSSASPTLLEPSHALEAKILPEPKGISEAATRRQDTSGWIVPIVLGLFFLCFVSGAWHAATTNPLWMDEVLTLWAARLPSYHAVWSALQHGSEASPPVFPLLLHALRNLLGDDYAVFRIPSILGSCVSGLCLLVLLRRYLGTVAAGYGTAFGLLGIVAWHGVEIRPYALVTACFTLAVLLWDGLDQGQRIWGRTSSISAILAFAISLHFYATLFVPCLGAMELLWSALNRRVRIPVWIGLFLAGASSFLWLPFIRAQSRMIEGETASVDFYGRPTLGRLVHAYSDLMIFDKKQALFLALTICIVATVVTFNRDTLRSAQPDLSLVRRRESKNLYVIGACSVAFPLLVFAFACVVTKTFNVRYCLIAALGFSCFIAYLARAVRISTSGKAAILLGACPLTFLSERPLAASLPDQVLMLKEAPPDSPIVVGEGRLYFELEEAVPPEMKPRLVYLEAPAGVISPDPTNEHHLDRWRRIRPDLKVISAQTFFAQHPRFYLFHTAESTDVITTWLRKRHRIRELLGQEGDASLYAVDMFSEEETQSRERSPR